FLTATSAGRNEPPVRSSSAFSVIGKLLGGLWHLVTLNRKVSLGSGIVGFFTLVAIIGPIVIRQNPLKYTLDLMAPPSSA
ncbi:hypothetical protein Q8G50_34215, partial [Klebsiella pneumoniae]